MIDTKVVAEIGFNHMNDRKLMTEMIEAAAEAGATYLKTQTFSASTLKAGPWDTDGRREIYEKVSLSKDDHNFLRLECVKNNIEFMTSCFNAKDIEYIAALCNTIKVASPEVINIEMLEEINYHYGKRYVNDVFVSTGAATLNELEKCLDTLSNCNVTLLHCVSCYPCPLNKANLHRINMLKVLCNKVGYSGHCESIYDAIASLDFGVSIIEKHFTTNRDLPGRDNQFAILPSELKFLCNYIKNKNSMLKPRGAEYQECEKEFREKYRLRWTKDNVSS